MELIGAILSPSTWKVSLAIIIKDAPAVAAHLEFRADAHALEFAGGQDYAAPLAGVLFDLRDGSPLPGLAHLLVAFDQVAIQRTRQLRAFPS